MSDDRSAPERLAVLETQMAFVLKHQDDARDREHFIVNVVVVLALGVVGTVVTVVATLVHP